MPYQRALAHRLGFEPGSPDYETTALPTGLSRLVSIYIGKIFYLNLVSLLTSKIAQIDERIRLKEIDETFTHKRDGFQR